MSSALKWTEATIARLIKEGYGQGAGVDYKSWIDVRSFSSSGTTNRIDGTTVPRPYCLFSDQERRVFRLLDQLGAQDLRENWPLPRDITLTNAQEAGIRHPVYPHTAVKMVMTLDFLVIFQRTSGTAVYGVSCKPYDKLNDERVIEKLEIERRACKSLEINYLIVTPSMINEVCAENLEWLYLGASREGLDEKYKKVFPEIVDMFRREFRVARETTLAAFCVAFEQRHTLQAGTGLDVAKHLLRNKELITDIEQPDIQRRALQKFQLTGSRPVLTLVGGAQ